MKKTDPHSITVDISSPIQNLPKVRTFEEKATRDTFDDIFGAIEPLIAEGEYREANQVIKRELILLSGALGGNPAVRYGKVNKELYQFLPLIVAQLLNTESPEARAMLRREEAQRQEQNSRHVPAREEIELGLVFKVRNILSGEEKELEVLAEPFEQQGHLWAELREVTDNLVEKSLIARLADKGLVPYPDGCWNDTFRVVSWYNRYIYMDGSGI